MPDISVVIPAYNAEPYLPAAIESILRQTFSDFELIIIDDCSSDGTAEVINHYSKLDHRIRAYRNPVNLGIAGNRNRGVSLSDSKYLAWQDADDISLPFRLEKQYQLLELDCDVGIVGGFIEIFKNDKILGTRKYATADAELRRCIFRYSPIAQPTAMIRLEALRLTGNYNLKYPPAEDLDMTFRIGEHYKFANIPEVLIRYRESDTSATFTRLRKMELSTLEIRRIHAHSTAYEASLADKLYNLIHFLSVWVVPPKIKIRLFNWWRNR